MKNKIVKNYLYEGLGIPILMEEVEMELYEGEWYPKVDVKQLAEDNFYRLMYQVNDNFTGNEIQFIRSFMGLNEKKFAKRIEKKYIDILKYEIMENQKIDMDVFTHLRIRGLMKRYMNGED